MINIDNLKYKDGSKELNDGYRIVLFYENGRYSVQEYCKTIEGFMMGFADCDPILDEDDIPEFISNEDLLSRYLSIKDVIASAIYKTDGTLIARLEKENIIKHK